MLLRSDGRPRVGSRTSTPILGFDRWSITALPVWLTAQWRFFRLMP